MDGKNNSTPKPVIRCSKKDHCPSRPRYPTYPFKVVLREDEDMHTSSVRSGT